MADFALGEEIAPEQWPVNAIRPSQTPPEGIILTETGEDGWTRKILYMASMGAAEEVVLSEEPPRRPAIGKGGSFLPLQQIEVPIMHEMGRNEDVSLPAPGPFDQPPMPVSVPLLGQADAATPQVKLGSCATALEMPDGRVIQPCDLISLQDLCAIMGVLEERRTIPQGGGSFVGNGGGGGARGPQGVPGLEGPIGPPGPGSLIDFIVKTDGDFSAGPGAFIPVPGTAVAFATTTDGPALFFLQAVLGCADSENGHLGLRIDGTDYPLTARLLHTSPPDVDEFLVGAHASWPLMLLAGSHTAEVLLRGISLGEFCAASGLGIAATVSANPDIPLALSVLHR